MTINYIKFDSEHTTEQCRYCEAEILPRSEIMIYSQGKELYVYHLDCDLLRKAEREAWYREQYFHTIWYGKKQEEI